MSWPRGSLVTALLALSIPLANADSITVNTTTDDYADNSLCSLREAVEYFNLDKPVAGFQGCVSVAGSSTDIVSVPASSSAYVVNSRMDGSVDRGAIVIRRGLSINGEGIASNNRTLIQAVGAHRAFVISNTPVVQPPACVTTSSCTSAGAPALDAGSDTAPLNDFLTTDNTPTILINSVTIPVATTYTFKLYSRPYAAAADADPVLIGSLVLTNTATAADWKIISNTLAEGVHDITYTTTVNSGDEGAQSPALRIGVYAASGAVKNVAISQMEIQGCVTASITDCANSVDGTLSSSSANGLTSTYTLSNTTGKGGVIYNDEFLSLNSVIIHDGAALAAPAQGGALWLSDKALVSAELVQFRANKAAQGAAIYAGKNGVGISQGLFTENTEAVAGGAVVNVADSAPPVGTTGSGASQISDSTFSGNSALALSLQAGAIVSGSTIVLNQGGIAFNGEKVSVYNTILAGNPDSFPSAATATDCQGLPTSSSDIDFKFSLGVVGGGCDGVGPGLRLLKNDNTGTPVPAEKLMAQSNANGKCIGYVPASGAGLDAFANMGLLCPLAVQKEDDADVTSATHLPRLLDEYSSASESPIISKGSNSTATADACSGTDQRGKPRRSICDIGAAELQPITGTLLSGNAIGYGKTYTEALDSNLGDETLFQPSASMPCPAFALTDPADVLVPGCPWITIAPSKGRVVFNADGSYTYFPNSNFHGFDRFSFRIVTTLSKLNSTVDSQSRVVDAQIIMEPSNGISPYATSGSADGWMLLVLAGLGLSGLRRVRRNV